VRVERHLVAELTFERELAVAGLGDEMLELVFGVAGGEVEDRPRRAGEGEAVAVADIAAAEAGAMDRDLVSIRASPSRDRDVDRIWRRWDEVPEMGSGGVAEDRLRAGSEQGCLFRCVGGWDGADQVYASVELDQVACPSAPADLVARDAGRQELPARDHAMLTSGQLGDHLINVGLSCHIELNPTLIPGAPSAQVLSTSR
jgi:hypothetical protein